MPQRRPDGRATGLLAAGLRRVASAALRVADRLGGRGTDSPPAGATRPAESVPAPAPPAGGPPEHWRALVAARAPGLLRGEGMGVTGVPAHKPVTTSAPAPSTVDDGDALPAPDPGGSVAGSIAGATEPERPAGEPGARRVAERPAARVTQPVVPHDNPVAERRPAVRRAATAPVAAEPDAPKPPAGSPPAGPVAPVRPAPVLRTTLPEPVIRVVASTPSADPAPPRPAPPAALGPVVRERVLPVPPVLPQPAAQPIPAPPAPPARTPRPPRPTADDWLRLPGQRPAAADVSREPQHPQAPHPPAARREPAGPAWPAEAAPPAPAPAPLPETASPWPELPDDSPLWTAAPPAWPADTLHRLEQEQVGR